MSLTADIDGSGITAYCQSITWRQRLSRPSSAVVRFPAQLTGATTGINELHVYNNGGLVFSGPVWYQETQGSADSVYTELTAYDHLIYLAKRLCKKGTTPPGNLITPGSVLEDEITAPAILAAFINNTNTIDGPSNLTVGSIAGGGKDLSSVPTNFPMTIEDMRGLLVSTGQLDVVVVPGIGGSTVDLYNGDYGTDLSGSVSFGYQTGAFNASIATHTFDMEEVTNALWYLLGPRISETRWRGSITPTAPFKGGTWPPELVAQFMGSRATYGFLGQEIRIFDDNKDENSIRELFEEEWANEAWIRAYAREFASIRPDRGSPINFGVGDLIGVSAGSRMGGGFSGTQRVYEVEWQCDADGVVECTEILTSADQEGA